MPDSPPAQLLTAAQRHWWHPKWTLLVAAAAGVLVLLAAIWLVGRQPQPSEADDPQRQAEAHRTDLVNRLRLADRVLRSIAADVTGRGHEATRLGATEQRYFAAVAYAKAGQPLVDLLGAAAALPALGERERARLADGDSVIMVTAQDAADGARVMLVRSLARSATSSELLIAEVAQRYLWEAARHPTDADHFCVRDNGTATLHCSSPWAQAALGSLGNPPAAEPGPVSGRSGSDNWNGAQVRLDLVAPYASAPWTVLAVAAPHVAGLAGQLTRGRTAAVVAAALGVALVGLALRRRWHAVLGMPARTGNQIALAPRATAPGAASNLSLKLERQRCTIRAMADIDRASLSRANAQRLVELAAGHLLACTGCDLLLIGVLDRTVSGRMTLVLAPKSGALRTEQKVVDPSASRLLAIPPDGTWIGQLREFALLEPLAQLGADGVLVLPIYEDTNPVGIISLGFAAAAVIGTDESGNARAVAGRLSAALTAAARDEALVASTHFDATTALPNWHYLKENLGQQMSRAHRDRGQLALLFIDLDGLKKVNAISGHSRGDLVLAEAAARMRGCVREEDLVTRFGGDEFVVVLPRVAEAVAARRVADKLLEALARPYSVEGEQHHLGCSIGISVFPEDAQTVDGMLHSATAALFDAKAAGRGRYAFFDAKVNRAAVDRTELEQDLRRALANAEISVVYQPQIDLRSGQIEGVEALVRWRHPSRGIVPPMQFIAVAEQAGLIAQIGEFVMHTACAQFAAWDAEGLAPPRIAVNVSGLEIARTDIVARVDRILRDTGLRPLHLELEITEGTFLDDSGHTLDSLNQLQQRGVRIAVDDFGTGYSSLSYLHRLPIDVVKIDQSFVRELAADKDSGAIVRAILQVTHSLGKLVVAEGIETEQQRALLVQWGCDVGQGYLWSRPVAASEFGDFCREWRSLALQKAAALA